MQLLGYRKSYVETLIFLIIWVGGEAHGVQLTLYINSNFRGISTSMDIDRCENLSDEFNDKVSSARTNDCFMLYADYCCQGMALKISNTEDLSSTIFDRKASSVSPCGNYRSRYPKEIIETWDGHDQIMTQVVEYNDVAIYYDEHVQRSRGMWELAEFVSMVWQYTKDVYGQFGPEGSNLFAFFHAKSKRGSGSSTRNFFDRDSRCRNLIDLFQADSDAWKERPHDEDMDAIIEAAARLVEWSAKGVYFNPTWGGDKLMGWETWMWTEIFIYDVYTSLDMPEEAMRVLRKFSAARYSTPETDTFWFRDWFYPIYSKYGGSRVLNSYYEVLSRHFPRGQYELEWKYERHLNLGEYVHFFSGAVGVSLKDQAKVAFKNWDGRYEREFQQARRDFPKVIYSR